MAVMGRFFAVLTLLVGSVVAQPQLTVTPTNAACESGPTLVDGAPDTVASVPDADGFYSMFDGKTLKGWWENCLTTHSSQNRTTGGIWIADSNVGAIYSQQASNLAGSVLMTNKTWTHYEMIFDFWPAWGNDAGVFNRVVPTGSTAGRTYQTGLDYKQGSSIGGSYGEGGYANFNIDPYLFTNTFGVITVGQWPSFTAARNPSSFGCPSTGCGPANWHAVWDTAGWNQIRIKFFGGLVSGSPTRMQAWMRRINNPPVPPPNNWVPTHDSAFNIVTPANPIGLQIHGGSDYWNRSGRGTWYRNIRIRPLDVEGNPLVVSLKPGILPPGTRFSVRGGELVGNLAEPHRVVVRDARGRVLDRFSGDGGEEVRHRLADGTAGLLLVEIRTARGVEHLRVGAI